MSNNILYHGSNVIVEHPDIRRLDFIVDCRRGIRHNYDIVEGPMADDAIWNFIEDFVKGEISRAAFWELVKFKHPTHQIIFL